MLRTSWLALAASVVLVAGAGLAKAGERLSGTVSGGKEIAYHTFLIPADHRALLYLESLSGGLYGTGVTLSPLSNPTLEQWIGAPQWINEPGHLFVATASEPVNATLRVEVLGQQSDYAFDLRLEALGDAELDGTELPVDAFHDAEIAWNAFPTPNQADGFKIGHLTPRSRIRLSVSEVEGLHEGWHMASGPFVPTHDTGGLVFALSRQPGSSPAADAPYEVVMDPEASWRTFEETAVAGAGGADLVFDFDKEGVYWASVYPNYGSPYRYRVSVEISNSTAFTKAICQAFGKRIEELATLRRLLREDQLVSEVEEALTADANSFVRTPYALLEDWVNSFEEDVYGQSLLTIIEAQISRLANGRFGYLVVPSLETDFGRSRIFDYTTSVHLALSNIWQAIRPAPEWQLPVLPDIKANTAFYRWLQIYKTHYRLEAIDHDITRFLSENLDLLGDLQFLEDLPINATDEEVQRYLAKNATSLLAFFGTLNERYGDKHFPLQQTDDALRAGVYRLVLTNDLDSFLSDLESELRTAHARFQDGACVR